MARFIAAIDQGTTSSRCLLFDASGRVAGVGQREHAQITPEPGWVEHDALAIWNNTQRVIREALGAAGAQRGDVAAVGITNQRETVLIWDRRTGEPLHNALVWQDTRTRERCTQLVAEGGADRWRGVTGLPVSTYFSGTKLAWLLEHAPGVDEVLARGDLLAGTLDTWLIWNLTGGAEGGRHLTDVTNASRTQLFDLGRLGWDEGILGDLGIPRAVLPEVLPSSEPEGYGRTLASGPFGEELPIAGVLGDQQAALFGQRCFEPGQAKNTYGTGCFLLSNTGERAVQSRHGLLTTLGYQIAGQPPVYALEGSIAMAGALIQWMRDQLGLISDAAETEVLARTVEDTGDAYIVPAFSGLFAPHWRDDARGTIVGLSRYVTKAHLCRAALEATCFRTREVLDAMVADAGIQMEVLRVDGGMARNGLLLELQADLLGIPVERPEQVETTALGAALAAGLATGFFPGMEALAEQAGATERFEPRVGVEERERRFARWKEALERSFGWVRSE